MRHWELHWPATRSSISTSEATTCASATVARSSSTGITLGSATLTLTSRSGYRASTPRVARRRSRSFQMPRGLPPGSRGFSAPERDARRSLTRRTFGRSSSCRRERRFHGQRAHWDCPRPRSSAAGLPPGRRQRASCTGQQEQRANREPAPTFSEASKTPPRNSWDGRLLPAARFPRCARRSSPRLAHPYREVTMTKPSTENPDLRVLPDPSDSRATAEAILFEVRRVIVGQDAMLERILVGLLAGGHLLLEGVPGLAKTLTIKTLADILGGSFRRIQFTPDLMPSDLVGTRIYRPDQGGFEVEPGPVFANFLLADEINRAPAKVQSALLEVMQEHQVTIGHETFKVPSPFLVLATENPIEADGTYPLPEAQVDRFMLKIRLGYPSPAEEAEIVNRSMGGTLKPRAVLDPDSLRILQSSVGNVYVDPRIVSYAVTLVDATRRPD